VTASLVELVREALVLALWLAAPLLVAALIAGVAAGLVGALTQIHDPAVGLVARAAALGLALAMFAPSIARQLDAFTGRVWPLIAAVGTATGDDPSEAASPGARGAAATVRDDRAESATRPTGPDPADRAETGDRAGQRGAGDPGDPAVR
jgi:flagellar biosynthetic protein FliQ